jgi:alkanesulfonate monooxygenase SsuD/methylene tetrahydromethanopterin reductase-like flavin-dependent oxidoreductase (luciferase family)
MIVVALGEYVYKLRDEGESDIMKFGLQHRNYSFDNRNHDSSHIVDSLKNLVTRAETLGFDSFWVMDQFHQNGAHVGKPEAPVLESWTTISVLAGVTSKIKLGTLMTGVIYRHPSILAKIGTTLDVLSKGRLFMALIGVLISQIALSFLDVNL